MYKKLYKIRGYIYPLILICCIRSVFIDWYNVPSGSMNPTILEGDKVFVNKCAYDLRIPFTTWNIIKLNEPKRGDIIVFYSPHDGKRLVKRLIGMPGDKISMINNVLQINGETIKTDKNIEALFDCSHQVKYSGENSINSFVELELPANKYFMMGDNRNNSIDSRVFGFITRNSILGKARKILFSTDNFIPRSDRWWLNL